MAALAVWAALGAQAATVYRWVDEQGRTHFSDTVPDRYRDRARPVDLQDDTPDERERREAEDRAARDRARLPRASDAAPTPAPAPAPTAAPAKRPPVAPTADTDCDTWRRLYQESLDCFGPYRTVRGATRPEAFERCTAVDEPPPRCGRTLIR